MNNHDASNKVLPLNNDKSIIDEGDFIVRSTPTLPVKIAAKQSKFIDTEVVAGKYYNGFNFLKLPKEYRRLQLAFGITSPGRGEGKTLVAANMAASLALAYERKTVLIDLNFISPQLHKVFGADQSPGVIEALWGGGINLTQTKIEKLFILPSGNLATYQPGIDDITALRKIITTLKQDFDFIIVDMNSVFPVHQYPVLFSSEMDGLFAVVDTQATKKEDIDRIFRHIEEDQVIGYIFNKVDKANTY